MQEWGLLTAVERESLEEATAILRSRLDPSSRTLAAQDFRHASQQEGKSVADLIWRLERLFKLAYGRDGMSEETRGTLLYGQLQEGLRYNIMKAPAVSGSLGYKELCLTSRNKEKRLAELAKRRQYLKPSRASPSVKNQHDQSSKDPVTRPQTGTPSPQRQPQQNESRSTLRGDATLVISQDISPVTVPYVVARMLRRRDRSLLGLSLCQWQHRAHSHVQLLLNYCPTTSYLLIQKLKEMECVR